MRPRITKLILEKILELGVIYINAFFPPNYSYTKSSRRLLGLDSYPNIKPSTLSAILSRLKKQGLVARKGTRKKYSWEITTKGCDWLDKQKPATIPPKDDITRLVIFDIPERERKKRDTIRAELVSANFQKLQKSVWVGYNPLPEDFINMLDELNLKDKVHIFSVREKGTLSIA